MPRWLIAVVSTVVGLPLLATAGLPFYLGHGLLDLRGPVWEWAYALSTFVLLVTAIVVIMKVETALLRRADAAQQARARLRLVDDLATLRNDARLAHWAPLAERYRRVDHDLIEQWEARFQALRADPSRRPFAEHALHGDFPEDHQIDYWQDPEARRTCEHLRPVEGALRDAGIQCTPPEGTAGAPFVGTSATLDEPKLRQRFALPDFVEWRVESPEPHDPGTERLLCTACTSWLENGRGPLFPRPDQASAAL